MKKNLQHWLTKKLSQPDIERLCIEEATTEDKKVLIVHSDDMAYDYCFPRHDKANTKKLEGVSIIAKAYYEHIPVPDNSYDAIICTGLLEHVPDPQKVLKEFNRILTKGGKVVLSASYAFSTHNAPDNYFHFTVYGMRLLLESADFSIERVKPSCRPFRTLAILLQRICYQTDMMMPVKVLFFLVAKIIPLFDNFIRKDYGSIDKDIQMESSLYSNVQAVALKI